jgi:hypothetical protein
MCRGENSIVRRIGRIGCLIILVAGFGLWAGGRAVADDTADALKVFRAIETIKEAPPPSAGGLRRISVSERELNAYIAFRIENEKEEMMKELSLKLMDEQKLEGKLVLDLRGAKISSLLPDRATFFFAARLEAGDGKARIRLDKLFLEQQPIQPVVIDLILLFASRKDNAVPSSLNEWIDLPIGIRELRTDKERLTVLY